MTDDSDTRDRAMFAEEDRMYLNEQREYLEGLSRKAKYNRRVQIVNRVIGTLQDFTLASSRMSEKVWSDLLDQPHETERNMMDGIISAVAFFYEICQSKGWDFEYIIENAIDEAHTYGRANREMPSETIEDVSLTVSTEKRQPYAVAEGRLMRKLNQGEELTDTELRLLVERGGIETIPALREHMDNVRTKESREEMLEEMNERIDMFGHPNEPDKE